jgi:hypothetical protein
MKQNEKSHVFIFLIFLLLIGTSFTPVSLSNNLSSIDEREGGTFDGQILFAPMFSTTTYLINRNGITNHTWQSSYIPNFDAYWLGNGTILRPILLSDGGGVQKILWDGTVAWDYRYSVSGCTCHHDIKYLPNGNVLMIVWETKTRNQAIQAGRNPNTIPGNTFTPDKIIEVKPTGPSSGDVVWEWHVWDHLIQDYDSLKDNYGVVEDHPELININFGDDFGADWLHTNSLDYNPVFDQILIDVHNFDEVWVIDHSTTTEEAAGHTGGRYGKGGDLLYRWGNPQTYDRGTSDDQIFYGQHDASWIKPGYPGAGNILIFNNGLNRPAGDYSTIDEFTPPIGADGNYYLEPGSAYGPENLTWSYTADPPGSLYSEVFGGAVRLTDGDTLICDGMPGKFFEVTPDGSVVWQWTNPYPNPAPLNVVFKIDYVPPAEPPQPPPNETPDLECNGSLSWSDIKPGATVSGSFQVRNVGDPGSLLNWTVDSSNLTWGTWTFTPSSGEDLTPEQGPVTVDVSVIAPKEKNAEFKGSLQVQNKNNVSDYVLIPITLRTSASSALSLANPFLSMVRQWLSLLTEFLGRIGHGLFLSYVMMEQLFHHV